MAYARVPVMTHPSEPIDAHPPRSWRHFVAYLGLGWGLLELSAMAWACLQSFVQWEYDPVALLTLLASLAVIGVTLGLPGRLILSRNRRSSGAAYLASASLTTLSAVLLLVLYQFARRLIHGPSIESEHPEQDERMLLVLVAAALVRLAMLPALASHFFARRHSSSRAASGYTP
ncbi:hypothetical protein [Melittangium boletus]|uniref:Uncharacterized protein n=1 Tax=Melittangium boletus DSM 14713 TaxID=1294270 RepID=A0A250IE88_9BACT|nr:hypothetical protein [Melittangium boletus]ATB29553.1 hypothetical protein MEBOL_003008 [Melittangium boletus DSM 14713]